MSKVRFIEADVSDAQVRWGGHSDPRGRLVVGKVYNLEREEVHSYHTKYYLSEFPGESFNSVWFETVHRSISGEGEESAERLDAYRQEADRE